MHAFTDTTAAFKRAYCAAIKVQVHCEGLRSYDVGRRFMILRDLIIDYAVHRWNSSCSALSALLSLEGAFTNLLLIVLPQLIWYYCFVLLFGVLFLTSKKALNLDFLCRPQTIQYFDEGLDSSFVSAFGEKFAFFYTNTSSEKLIDK